MVQESYSLQLPDLEFISLGNWLDFSQPGCSKYIASITAAVIWFIWKARCDQIFKDKRPDFLWIAEISIAHVKEFKNVGSDQLGQNFFIINKPMLGTLCVYSAACWDENSGIGGAGFCFINTNACIILAGCCQIDIDSRISAGIQALQAAILTSIQEDLNVRRIVISCRELWDGINGNTGEIDWRAAPLLSDLHHMLLNRNEPKVDYIPWKWNRIASNLAGLGRSSVQKSLFHRGLERPRWLMKLVEKSGFHF